MLDMAFSRLVLTLLPLLTFCQSNAQTSTPCDSILQKMMEDAWKEFREIHPSNFQTIALKHYGSDTCVFVMSEPPGWVSQDSIKKLFNSYGGHVGIGKHAWGYNGVLTDAIGCVALNSSKFLRFQSKLFKLIYGTDYKPYYTNLDKPVQHTYTLPDSLVYMPDEESIKRIENAPLFSATKLINPKHEQLSVSIVDLLKGDFLSSGIYYSVIPGYVTWIVNPAIASNDKSEIVAWTDSTFKADARRFLLDTDLIIDAISSPRGVALVGRERKAPVDVLPPLRAETILLLAQHASDTLYTDLAAELSTRVEDSLYYTPIHMNESISHSEIGFLMVQTAVKMLSNGKSHIYDFFSTPTNLDMVRLNQYVYIQEAFKTISRFDDEIQYVTPKKSHVWSEIPTTIVTNAPLIQSNDNIQ